MEKIRKCVSLNDNAWKKKGKSGKEKQIRKELKKSSESWVKSQMSLRKCLFTNVSLGMMMPVVCEKRGKVEKRKIQVKETKSRGSKEKDLRKL